MKEIILENNYIEIKYSFSKLLIKAIDIVYQYEKPYFNDVKLQFIISVSNIFKKDL
jgi:hypothetical protein